MPGMYRTARLAKRLSAGAATALVLAMPVFAPALAGAALQNGAAARDNGGTIASPPAPGEEGALVAEGAAPDLALIYTGSVVGYVEPCG